MTATGAFLAGAITGIRARSKLLAHTTSEPAQPEAVFLDFNNVEVATASYLRESVLSFRDEVRQRHSNFYPVIANASDLVTEELRALVTVRSDVLMLCSLDEAGMPHKPYLIGELDPKQRMTLELVQQRGETGAAELMREYGQSEKDECPDGVEQPPFCSGKPRISC